MTKILGLDLGTNSIGWAVVDTENNKTFKLLEKGVHIFQEGVKIEKGIEGSKAAERTEYRSARRIKFRRKLRKINTLKVLSQFDFCPNLTDGELANWRYKKVYPENEEFRNWWLTDDNKNKNPYYFRALAVNEELDLANQTNRYNIGRAFYHIAQRRGFLSNRLEGTKESDGAVKKAIAEITEAKGDKTLGQYFYNKYLNGEKIRNQYTHREEHYLQEFDKICEVQQLPNDLIKALKKAIFYQRPLKSQKGLVGKCPFETNKPRCAISNPAFEEYRMLCFINNIKIKTPNDEKLRSLNDEEKLKILPQFFRKSKEHFDFDDLAKQLAPKNQYKFYKDRNKYPEDYLFNYSMKTTVSGCPVSARFASIFGENWKTIEFKYSREKDGKESTIDINDVWHVLFTFDSEDKLTEFAQNRLMLGEDQIKEFTKIHLKQDYASLSLKAINKILPYLRQGLIYSHAVFLANMEAAIPTNVWSDDENKKIISEEISQIIKTQNEEKQVLEVVNGMIKTCREKENNWRWSEEAEEGFNKDIEAKLKSTFGANRWKNLVVEKRNRIKENAFGLFKTQMQNKNGQGDYAKVQRIDDRIRTFITDNFEITNGSLDKLYHPSAIDVYPPCKKGEDGKLYLGSPMVSSVRNPMAMRALHRLRKLVNELIKQDIIDATTKINIEMARDLKNANERKALQSWQRDRENLHKEYSLRIKEHYDKAGITREPSEDDILKYQYWEEQKRICLYTGDPIGVAEFLGADPKFDIEHTIPRSQSLDNSQENKTLCQSRFNREIKRNKIPYELANHTEILERIEKWKEKYEELEKQIEIQVKKSRGAATKEAKDGAIQRRHKLSIERNYWKNKFNRFTMEEVPSGFKNSQMVDIGIITKYSRMYLNTLFDKVYTVKGNTVADFRKIWGLQDEYKTKARVNHIHHCIDAITIACMTKQNYEELAKFYHDWEEMHNAGVDTKPRVNKPWDTFTQDVKEIEKEVFVSHHTPDNLPKQSKKKIRIRGKVQFKADYKKDAEGNYIKDGRGKKIVEKYYYQEIIDKNGKKKQVKIPLYERGDTVRGSLHKETFYGAIEREVENKKGEKEKVIKYVVRKPLDSLENSNIKNIVDEKVQEIIRIGREQEKELRNEIDDLNKQLRKAEEHEEEALKQQIEDINKQIDQLYTMPNKNGNPIPIKKVRLNQPTVTNPLHIKKQRDKNQKQSKPYKENYYAANDGNYLMAIYEGKDDKGKIKRDFEIVNNRDAGSYFKHSVQSVLNPQGIENMEGLVPEIKQSGKLDLPLKCVIKTGTMVILWENNPDEVWEINVVQLNKRLFKLTQFESDGRVQARFHQVAKPDNELKRESEVDFEQKIEKVRLSKGNLNMLVQGIDFKLNILGQIEKI
jgi:CRISPR-associated endonuclease Csn1